MSCFGEIFRWEVTRALRRPSTWVYLAVLVVIGTLSTVDSDPASTTFFNAPLNVAGGTVLLGFLGILVTAALFGDAANRDVQTGMHPLFYAAPISKMEYLGGRFLGAFAVNAALLLAVPLSLWLSAMMPYADPARVGPFRMDAYVSTYLLFLLPNLLINASVLFGISALSRRSFPSYLGAIGLFAGYALAMYMIDGMQHSPLATLVDPSGMMAVFDMASDWTPVEKNALGLRLQDQLLWNRLFWMGLGAAVLATTCARFRFAHHAAAERRRPAADVPETVDGGAPVVGPTPRVFGFGAQLGQVWAIAGRSFREVLVSRDFLFVVAGLVAFVLLAGGEVMADDRFGVPAWPLTQYTASFLGSQFVGIIVSLLTAFYAGELVWRERDARVHEISDATPVPDWVPYAGKFLALALMLAAIQAVLMAAGMALQALQGYYRFELGLYAQVLFGLGMADYLLLAAVALLVHALVNHKYVGHFVVALFLAATLFAGRLGVEHNLLVYGADPGWTYSDMAGFGPFLAPVVWFKLYWGGWALLMAVAASLFWVRGTERGATRRIRQARIRLNRPALAAAAVAVVQIVGLGGFVFYNTNVLNEYQSKDARGTMQAQYERRYKRYESAAQPWVAGVHLHVEIHPEQRRAELRGTYRLVNRTAQAIDTVHLSVLPVVRVKALRFSRPARRALADHERGYWIYTLDRPLQPGDSLRLDFAVEHAPRGFTNDAARTAVVRNGTFIGNRWLPSIGYQRDFEVTANAERRALGLPRRDHRLSIHDQAARRIPRVASDADWIAFEAVIGTAGDETAVAPGALKRTWTRGGRRYFHYQAQAPILNFYAILSSNYAVHRTEWNGVQIEVLHHPDHAFNVPALARTARASLEYYSRSFGPYRHGQLRLVEFPRYQQFARAYPGMIVYSESSSMLGRVNHAAGQVDAPMMVTAHEVGHQWWGHQVMGADVQGSQVLAETLAQYGAMMVLEQAHGPEHLRGFLEAMQIEYLNRRGDHQNPEVPLLLSGDHDYLHYRKGAVVMYALREYVGEARVNAALRRIVQAHAYTGPPYPTTLDLYRELHAVTPDSVKYLLDDLVRHITLWDVRAGKARAVPVGGGRYRVTFPFDVAKVRADSLGNDTPVPMNDLVEIGVFAEGDDARGPALYLRKHRLAAGRHTVTVTVSGRPALAGVDPRYLLLTKEKEEMDARMATVPIAP
ncbi:M1 family aminopeptidase [Longimicrobium sp.]|uniref:M1 family aminopeptidase n=1 Tax=Longimicrobium sp. TaxID=2029185 RepID=UPI002EDB7C3E